MTIEKPILYTVFIDDNFHHMDEDERYKGGDFTTWEKALDYCKQIVDQFLLSSIEKDPTVTAEKLYSGYTGFGEDPFITPSSPDHPHFSAWNYAKERCAELCDGRD